MKKNYLILSFLSYFLLHTSYFAIAQQPPSNMRLRSKMKFGGLANIGGYTARGREYALAGSTTGLEIIDITQPDTPKLIKHIPALQSLWREVKVYRDYAYVTTEAGGQGLQIINLSGLPDTNVVYKSISGPDSLITVITRSHSLHIDTAKGFLYLYGGITTYKDLGNTAGAVVLDLKPDPWNPKFAGRYTANYIHDGYVENDTCWSGQIYKGTLTVIDFTDKKNPITLGEVKTPFAFTHNTWLSGDHKTCFTTDEKPASYLASYDVTDLTNIRLLDIVRSTAGDNSIVHNTHIRNDYAITSWYSEGVLIHDVHRPHNMVQVGQFDTYQCGGVPNYVGTWGAFPFFPSGNIVLSDLEGDFFCLTPTYQRACYLEGNIIEAGTGAAQPITGVQVKIISDDVDKKAVSDDKGNFYTGQVSSGFYTVVFSKQGYITVEKGLFLTKGQVTTANIVMNTAKKYTVSGKVDTNAYVRLSNLTDSYTTKADSSGRFLLSNVTEGEYALQSTTKSLSSGFASVYVNRNVSDIIYSRKVILDNFWTDLGWQVEGTTQSGAWKRINPTVSSSEKGYLWRPKTSLIPRIYTDYGFNYQNDNYVYSTGNGNCIAGNDALINNYTTLVSPAFPKLLLTYSGAFLLDYWYTNQDTLSNLGGSLKIFIRTGASEQEVFSTSTSKPSWQTIAVSLSKIISQSDSFKVVIKATSNSNSFTQVTIDNALFSISEATLDIDNTFTLQAVPNPFSSTCTLNFDLGIGINRAEIQVYNLVGQLVERKNINIGVANAEIGKELSAGIYFAKIVTDTKISKAIKIIKQN